MPSFITTLGMLLILNGAVFLWTGGAPRGALADNFRSIGREGIEGIPVIEQLPCSVILLVAVGIGAVSCCAPTSGGSCSPSGDNDRAAALSGVRVPRCGSSPSCSPATLGGGRGHPARRLRRGFGPGRAGPRVRRDHRRVLGGVVLGGGRGSVVGRDGRRAHLEALFTLLNL